MKRNPAADAAREERRLKQAIDANVLTDYVKASGMGGIDTARDCRGCRPAERDLRLQGRRPNAALYFTDALPAAVRRVQGELNQTTIGAARQPGLPFLI